MSVSQGLLPFKVELVARPDPVTAYAGVPVVVEALLAAVPTGLFRELRDALGYQDWKVVRRHLVSLVVLVAAGGEHLADLEWLRGDAGLEKLLGFKLSSPTQAKEFLYAFHQGADGHALTPEEDASLSEKGHAQVRPEGPGLQVLEAMVLGVVAALQAKRPKRRATLDVDATIIEAHKKQALMGYEGTVGYQPQMAWWAEQGTYVCDEFRDGNVPAAFDGQRYLQRTCANLPAGIEEIRLRADSALYDERTLTWADARGIGFAVSADMSPVLAAEVAAVHEWSWKKYRNLKDPEDVTEEREWAEVPYVPAWKRNDVPGAVPFRYIAVRVRPRQRPLFGNEDRVWRHFAVVTNFDWAGDRVVRWHREKQGSVEHGHDILKNDLGGGVMPSGRFGANAAWWRVNVLVHGLLSLVKALDASGALADARPKTLRLRLLNLGARLISHGRTWCVRLSRDLLQARILVAVRRALVELAARLRPGNPAPA